MKQYPKYKTPQIVKELSNRWGVLSSAERAKY